MAHHTPEFEGAAAAGHKLFSWMAQGNFPKSRLPFGADVVSVLAAVLARQGYVDNALMVVLGATAYLRPCESNGLRVEDLSSPLGGRQFGVQNWTITIAPAERGRSARQGPRTKQWS